MTGFAPEQIEGLVITIDDVRRAGYCTGKRGARGWFEQHGLDFRGFLKEGISAALFLEKGDAHAARVVKKKLERAGG